MLKDEFFHIQIGEAFRLAQVNNNNMEVKGHVPDETSHFRSAD